MPIQINSPGWRVKGAGPWDPQALRVLPGLPPDFLTAQSRVAEERSRTCAGHSRREAAPGRLSTYDLSPARPPPRLRINRA